MYTHKTYLFDQSANIDTCHNFRFINPMPIEDFTDTNVFMDKQSEYDYLLDNVVLDGNMITFFFQDGNTHVSISDKSGEILMNKAFYGVLPNFYFSDRDEIFTAFNAYEYIIMSEDGLLPQSDKNIGLDDNFLIVKLRPLVK